MRSPGHPPADAPVFTPERIAAILDAFAVPTCTEKYAAVQAGISDRTLRKWLEQGRTELDGGALTPHADFYLRFERVRGERVSTLLVCALTSEESSPATSARWVAGHLDPASFSASSKVEVHGAEGGPIQHELTARVVVLPRIADERALSDGAVAADAEAGAFSREPG